VYFINTRPVTDIKWGTPNPITIRDPDFRMVPVRANGTVVLRIVDTGVFLKEVIGTDSAVEADEIAVLLRQVIATAFSEMVLTTGLGAIDLQTRQVELAGKLREFVQEKVDDEFGLAIVETTLQISLPEEITQALTRGAAKAGETSNYIETVNLNKLQQANAADAILAAANNPGGSAMGDMMQMGMGMAMANQMAGQMGNAFGGQQGGTPPPMPAQAMYHVDQNGQPGGPYSVAQIQQGVAAGQVTAQTLVWTNGMAAWTPAGQVPALASLFSAPPPIPGAGTPPPMPPAPPAPAPE
jgi:membrane protease subunit (stomatin/prohibitin family)